MEGRNIQEIATIYDECVLNRSNGNQRLTIPSLPNGNENDSEESENLNEFADTKTMASYLAKWFIGKPVHKISQDSFSIPSWCQHIIGNTLKFQSPHNSIDESIQFLLEKMNKYLNPDHRISGLFKKIVVTLPSFILLSGKIIDVCGYSRLSEVYNKTTGYVAAVALNFSSFSWFLGELLKVPKVLLG